MPTLHPIDSAILILYLIGVVVAGILLSRQATKGIDSYFLGGRNIPWFALGISNASGMFDATGTMAMVAWMFVYGVKSLWLPWLWPTFNQIFMMVFLAAWLRRSGAVTGADWLRTRFGSGRGFELAHLSVVTFALVAVIAFIAYAFVGIGKFAQLVLPWDYSPNTYAMVLLSITTLYVAVGGMKSVVLTDVMQFVLLTIASFAVAWIAIVNTTAEQIAAATPVGWKELSFGWRLDYDWSGKIDGLNEVIANDIYVLFTPFVMMAFFNGLLKSIAGPLPGYDMQRVLATRNARDASLMSAIVSPVLFVPRYLLIAGITVLALVYYSEQLQLQGAQADFEKILPFVISNFIPVGVVGLLLAGLFAAFMSTFDSNLNAGAAYLVNDVYRRYIRPDATTRELTMASYTSCFLLVTAGLAIGLQATSINDSLQWIAGGLFGGYAVPNLLKWVWWRLNAAGYVAGMMIGVALALLLSSNNLFVLMPVLLLASTVGSVVVSLITKPDDTQVLSNFYRKVRPWGFWKPIRDQVIKESPEFEPNRDFAIDMLNCAIGIVWQMALCAMPVYFVLRQWPSVAAAAIVVVLTSLLLKRLWYDRLTAEHESPIEV